MSTQQAARALPEGRYGAERALRPPRWRRWVFTGIALVFSVGVAIVATGAWIAYTSMRGNAWFGHSLTPDPAAEKLYDAVYVARLMPYKRHPLAARVPRMAVISAPYMVEDDYARACMEVIPAGFANGGADDNTELAFAIES